MNTKTWVILRNGSHEDYPYQKVSVYASYDAALSAAKKLASKTMDDYTIFGAETVTAVKTPDVDVIAVTAPA